MILFDEKLHTYTDSETGNNLTSVSGILKLFKKPFNTKEQARKIAEREGISVETILETWDEIRDNSTDKGKNIHKIMEDYITCNIKEDEYQYLYDSYEDITSRIGKPSNTKSEEIVYSVEDGIAGTADIIYEFGDYFIVGDFKTNKKFRFLTNYKEYFLPPVDHLSMCEFNTYSLQLSLYGYMYSKMTGRKCNGLIIMYLPPDGKKFYPIRCNYLKTDAQNLVKWCKDYNLIK